MSMSENQKKIISQVLIQFKAESIIDEEKIVFYVKLFAKINPISKEERFRHSRVNLSSSFQSIDNF